MTTLYVQDPSGFREAPSQTILESARALIARRFRKGSPVLDDSSNVRVFLRIHLGARDHEVFGVLYLDNRHRLIGVEDLFRGTFDTAPVFPREVVKRALEENAAAVVCYHNHPSGTPEPSQADELITRRLKDSLAMVGVRLLDHLIVADDFYSFAEHGRL
jgi:DNA repair protein RadC